MAGKKKSPVKECDNVQNVAIVLLNVGSKENQWLILLAQTIYKNRLYIEHAFGRYKGNIFACLEPGFFDFLSNTINLIR